MQKIMPFLWFDNQAEEAMNYYTSVFKNSKKGEIRRYGKEGPGSEGSVMTVSFQLEGLEFGALNGGPHFNFTPANSFFVSCETEKEIDELYGKLSEGGSVLMELQKYPFSEKYAWLNDSYGLSWQLFLVGKQESIKQKITPFLMFTGDRFGKAEEVMNFYCSLFGNSGIEIINRYGKGEGDVEGAVVHARFSLEGQQFMAMESSLAHMFTFTPAVSFFVNCKTQKEVDMFWDKLSEGGAPNQCGWLTDKYGVSWQIVPTVLGELLGDPDPAKSQSVMKAMLQMKKLDIAKLEQAFGKADVK